MTASPAYASSDIHTKARINMVDCQIRPNRVGDERLLVAMSALPREMFVPPALAGVAYADRSVQIAPGRFMMEPMFLARLLEAAAIDGDAKALVIGAGTGYSAALLSAVARSVVALESDMALAEAARTNLARLGCGNVSVVSGPLTGGWPAAGPYGTILIDGAIRDLPETIAQQLAAGGSLVAIEMRGGRSGSGVLYRNVGGSVSGRAVFDAAAPYLPGFEPQPVFAL
ncbi:MAG TPA: protein-L-isoaspartate O-methyltransferase [Alphaproteobacteria bacterium]|nr:protein-L-isoaspartate O-methyltransferase [Alphaproteobacteria bacterium]